MIPTLLSLALPQVVAKLFNDLWYRQWRQSWHRDNSGFSAFNAARWHWDNRTLSPFPVKLMLKNILLWFDISKFYLLDKIYWYQTTTKHNKVLNACRILGMYRYRKIPYIDDLVLDCSALAKELLQSCTKPSIWLESWLSFVIWLPGDVTIIFR